MTAFEPTTKKCMSGIHKKHLDDLAKSVYTLHITVGMVKCYFFKCHGPIKQTKLVIINFYLYMHSLIFFNVM